MVIPKPNIEIALHNVFSHIGNDYELPDTEAEFIISQFNGNEIRNPYFGQTPLPIKFEMGTQKELNEWIANTTDKYPVVWLVYPDASTTKNTPGSVEAHRRARLIFAIDNEVDKDVKTRLHTTLFVLDGIVEKFLSLMRNSHFKKYIWIDKTSDYTKTLRPNKSSDESETQKTGITVDTWDVITLDCDIYVMPKCIPKPIPAVTPESEEETPEEDPE